MQRGSKSTSNFSRQKSFSRPINNYNASNTKYSSGDQPLNKDRHGSSSSQGGAQPGPSAGGSSNLRHASSPTNRRDSYTHIPESSRHSGPHDHRHGSLGHEGTHSSVNMGGYSSHSGNVTNDQELREIHDKMSQKITQLTKVVFNLNTKNDEHNETLRKLKSSHKQELAAVAQDMESKLAKLKEKASNEIQIKNRIKELETELENLNAVKNGFETKITEIKSQAQKELDSRVQDHERKFNAVNKQVTAVIEKLEAANGDNQKVKTEYWEVVQTLRMCMSFPISFSNRGHFLFCRAQTFRHKFPNHCFRFKHND